MFFGKIKSPNSNNTGKSGTQLCEARLGGSWGGDLRLHLVLTHLLVSIEIQHDV